MTNAEEDAPRCWRSECRDRCYYPNVCSERHSRFCPCPVCAPSAKEDAAPTAKIAHSWDCMDAYMLRCRCGADEHNARVLPPDPKPIAHHWCGQTQPHNAHEWGERLAYGTETFIQTYKCAGYVFPPAKENE